MYDAMSTMELQEMAEAHGYAVTRQRDPRPPAEDTMGRLPAFTPQRETCVLYLYGTRLGRFRTERQAWERANRRLDRQAMERPRAVS